MVRTLGLLALAGASVVCVVGLAVLGRFAEART
jgi:hypothetical protein